MDVVHTEQPSIRARGVLLHELDAGGVWRRVAGLVGDRALFVGRSSPCYAAVTRGCSGLRANSVYAADLSAHAAIVLGLRQGCAGGFEPLVYPSVGGPLRRPIWFRPTADLRGQVSCCRSFSMTVAYRQAHQHPVASILTCLVHFAFCIFVFLEGNIQYLKY